MHTSMVRWVVAFTGISQLFLYVLSTYGDRFTRTAAAVWKQTFEVNFQEFWSNSWLSIVFCYFSYLMRIFVQGSFLIK